MERWRGGEVETRLGLVACSCCSGMGADQWSASHTAKLSHVADWYLPLAALHAGPTVCRPMQAEHHRNLPTQHPPANTVP